MNISETANSAGAQPLICESGLKSRQQDDGLEPELQLVAVLRSATTTWPPRRADWRPRLRMAGCSPGWPAPGPTTPRRGIAPNAADGRTHPAPVPPDKRHVSTPVTLRPDQLNSRVQGDQNAAQQRPPPRHPAVQHPCRRSRCEADAEPQPDHRIACRDLAKSQDQPLPRWVF